MRQGTSTLSQVVAHVVAGGNLFNHMFQDKSEDFRNEKNPMHVVERGNAAFRSREKHAWPTQ